MGAFSSAAGAEATAHTHTHSDTGKVKADNRCCQLKPPSSDIFVSSFRFCFFSSVNTSLQLFKPVLSKPASSGVFLYFISCPAVVGLRNFGS